ncbi:Fimbrial protein [Klebsiella pasteurii]|nr:Fimbrial protein [Klebsiella pasteurii]
MDKQRGFTLIELMVVIGIIAILSAIGIPAYQNYLRKAALTDMLQTFVPFRTAIELCALEHGGLTPCDGGSNGIPSPATTRNHPLRLRYDRSDGRCHAHRPGKPQWPERHHDAVLG